jgi:hypothetical protein
MCCQLQGTYSCPSSKNNYSHPCFRGCRFESLSGYRLYWRSTAVAFLLSPEDLYDYNNFGMTCITTAKYARLCRQVVRRQHDVSEEHVVLIFTVRRVRLLLLVSYCAYSSIPKMEAIYASETPSCHRTTLGHTLHSYRTENLKSNLLWHADPLLGNDRERSSYIAAVTE